MKPHIWKASYRTRYPLWYCSIGKQTYMRGGGTGPVAAYKDWNRQQLRMQGVIV